MTLSQKVTAPIRSLVDSRIVDRLLQVFDHRSDNRMTERGMLSHAFEFKRFNEVDGDYFEFGLWRGKTFLYAHRMRRRYRQEKMLLWGFDSFEGLPGIGDERDNVWRQGQFACGEDEFRGILRRNGVRETDYQLVKGFYQDSLNEQLHTTMAGRRAAIVYIDCDLYESTKQVLAFLRRYLVNGSIVCFDDFYNYKGAPDQGEQRALTEFLAEDSRFSFLPYLDYAPLGKSFIVRVKNSD